MEKKAPRKLMVEALMKHPEGLTLVSLAKTCGLHRHTTTKYFHELIGAGIAYQRKVGPTRLCYLREKIDSKEKEKEVLKELEKKWVGRKSQIKLTAVVLLLGVILASGAVIASNFTNKTINVSYTGASILNLTVDNVTQVPSENSGVETIPSITETNILEINASENNTQETPPTSVASEPSENVTSTPDTLPPIYSEFGVNDTDPKIGEAVEFSAFWQDDYGLDEWVFSWNASGSWENETYSFVSSYDEKTQILTKQGWKYLKDLSYEDEVATLSGKEIKWEKPVRIISLPYDNGIYKINGEIDLLVTPDHKVYARLDNTLGFLINRIKDFFFGINIDDFRFIDIEDAYELTKASYHLTFLDEELKPVYVSRISKETYKGKIFDLTVPSHIVLVKRFGKAVWSSNLNVKEAWSNVTKVVNSVGTIAYQFYASDLAGNWAETEVGVIEVKEENITQPLDILPPSYSSFGVNSTNPKKGESVEFSAFWQDDFGLDKWIFSWNASGSWENETYSFVSSYDEKTQILTKNGWKYFKELGYDDEIATLNLAKEDVEWNRPLRIVSSSYRGKMYRITGNDFDLVVSPDHKIYGTVMNQTFLRLLKSSHNIPNFALMSPKSILCSFSFIYSPCSLPTIIPTTIPQINPTNTLNAKSSFNSRLSNEVTATTAITPLKTILSFFDTMDNNYSDEFISVSGFELIEIDEIYQELQKNPNLRLVFLDNSLTPILVKRIEEIDYSGKIYDLTVSNHIILVKREGKAVWSSNLNAKEGWSNITKVVSSVGTIAYQFYASDLAGNWAETEIGTIEVKEEPNITQLVEVLIQYPEKVTRGESVAVKATVTNIGLLEAKNVVLTWELPFGFEIVSGNKEKNCGNLVSNASCISEIIVQTSYLTELGINEIKAVVNYE